MSSERKKDIWSAEEFTSNHSTGGLTCCNSAGAVWVHYRHRGCVSGRAAGGAAQTEESSSGEPDAGLQQVQVSVSAGESAATLRLLSRWEVNSY